MSFRVPEEDIKNEAAVLSFIRDQGGHANIIGVLDHGWLTGSFSVYFLDMELGDLTLFDYIEYCRNPRYSAADIGTGQSSPPALVRKDCLFHQRIHNMWTIGTHIARGLEFMHSHNYVHRDLKPSNGTPSKRLNTNRDISPLLSSSQPLEAYRLWDIVHCNF